MTLYLAPICLGCEHFIEIVPPTPEEIAAQNEARARGEEHFGSPVPNARCKAFPDGILQAIMTSERDHRKRIAGDNGIHFDPKSDQDARYADLLFSIPNDGEDDA